MTAPLMQHRVVNRRVEPPVTALDGAIVSDTVQERPAEVISSSRELSEQMVAAKIWKILKEAWAVPSLPEAIGTIYFEIGLDGSVHVYEMTDAQLLQKIGVETRASFLPVPDTIQQAHEYVRSNSYRLEMFENWALAEYWMADYSGFGAEEIRAELRQYQMRRASYLTTTAS
jgi:hypothetical protein